MESEGIEPKKEKYPYRIPGMDYCNGPFEEFISAAGTIVGAIVGLELGLDVIDYIGQINENIDTLGYLIKEAPKLTVGVTTWAGFKIGRSVGSLVGNGFGAIFGTYRPLDGKIKE